MELLKRMILLISIVIGVSVCICQSGTAIEPPEQPTVTTGAPAVTPPPPVGAQCKMDTDCIKVCQQRVCLAVVGRECPVVRPRCKKGECVCESDGRGGGPGLPDIVAQILKTPPSRELEPPIQPTVTTVPAAVTITVPAVKPPIRPKPPKVIIPPPGCGICKSFYCRPKCGKGEVCIKGGPALPDKLVKFCIEKCKGKVVCDPTPPIRGKGK